MPVCFSRTVPVRAACTARLFLLTLSASFLAACGGGGGGSGGGSAGTPATITGTSSGSVPLNSSLASGILSVSDPDAGEAVFLQPASLSGVYGTWSVSIAGSTLAWAYNLAQVPSAAATETLTVKTKDGASRTISVSVAGSGSQPASLVSSVPDPVYTTGIYDSEKAAVFNRLNADRARCGFGKLAQNAKLDQAAQNHATYLAVNKISTHSEVPGLVGFTGTNAGARWQHVGYSHIGGSEILASLFWGSIFNPNSVNTGISVAELGSTNTLLRLYASVYHLTGAMNFDREVGIGIDNRITNNVGDGNIKPLVINTATPSGSLRQSIGSAGLATFPCGGETGLIPDFGEEDPDPFPDVDRFKNPYGHPVYVTSGPGTTITLNSGTIAPRGGSALATRTLTAANDPQNRLQPNQVFLVPTARLLDNTTYDVALSGTSTGLVSTSNLTGAWTRNFSFTTGTTLSQ
jgi:VCBS repeat-containing protein